MIKLYNIVFLSLLTSCGESPTKSIAETSENPTEEDNKDNDKDPEVVAAEENTQSSSGKYETQAAKDCYASGFVMEQPEVDLVCSTSKRKYSGECSGENFAKIIANESERKRVAALITDGYKAAQCEDRGFGVYVTFLKGGHETRSLHQIGKEFVSFEGKWKSIECIERQHASYTFSGDILTRIYTFHATDDCKEAPIAEVKSTGKFTLASAKGALFLYQPDAYLIKATSVAGKSFLDDAILTGCTTGFQLNSEFEIKREQNGGSAGCINEEFLLSLQTEDASRKNVLFGIGDFKKANASTSDNGADPKISLTKIFE